MTSKREHEDAEEDDCIGPMPSDDSKSKKRKGENLNALFL